MDKDKVREALACWRDGNIELDSQAGLGVLIDLAEQWLAVSGKMPEKLEHNHGGACGSAENCPPSYNEIESYNKAIDQCTLAFTGRLLSEYEIKDVVFNALVSGEGPAKMFVFITTEQK